jgi:putative heme-binding domain-containing protein
LASGENRINVSARAVDGPAAVAVELTYVGADGTKSRVVSDARWTNEGAAATSLGEVSAAMWGLSRRPPTIDPFDNYEQWQQAKGESAAANQPTFWTPPGFEIALVRQAQPDESSWVSMAFDPKGRLTIGREDKGLLRMTLDATGRKVEKTEMVNDELQECRGLLYAHDSLYANANNSKALYRLRDTNGDGQFDEVLKLREFPGSVGHGRNDLTLGPDGMIYGIFGDSVDVPKENIVDRTSPFREARRGETTREGFLLRTDRDGKKWELLAAGLRNPFGIAFNPDGECFTYDADAEFDMGSPWYRPTRVSQLVSGADIGWRGVTGKWPPYFPDHADNALPMLDIGRGSPTAVAFGTATNFPLEYRKALFILDWTYGRILALHLAPRGAGYRAQAETFLKGRPLNVTDLAAGPDGALYVVTGGRKTQSALYRIAWTGGERREEAVSPHEIACAKHAESLRALRRILEMWHERSDDLAISEGWKHLSSPDPRVRYAARIAIEHQPIQRWRDLALAEAQPNTALTALMALARFGDKDGVPQIIDRLVALPAHQFDAGQALMLVQAYHLSLDLVPDPARREAILKQLEPLYPQYVAQWLHVTPAGTGAKFQHELARLLARLGSPQLISKTGQSLLVSDRQEDRLQALFVLKDVREGWTRETRRAYFTALNEGTTFVSGEGMPKFLAQLREDALATLTDQERRDLADVLSPTPEPEEKPLPPRPVVKQWKVDDFTSLLADHSQAGDPARGATVFRDALCVRCHRVGARGPAVGPDLSHVGGRFSRRDMLESILTPSKVVAENYRNVQVRTTDGRVLVGRVLVEGDFRAQKLRIATEPMRPTFFVELAKQEIEEHRESETSPMPQGLLDSFRAEEVLDLLAFLQAGAQAPRP